MKRRTLLRRGVAALDYPMKRRAFVAGIAAVIAARLAEAQHAAKAKVPRIGMLTLFAPDHRQSRDLSDAFRQGLRELGYVEGQNLIVEYRSAQGRFDRLPELFAEAARLKVDVIFLVGGTPAARAAKEANIAIPVVAPAMADPVRDGVVASLGRPGGNITGSSFLGPGLVPKRIELLKQTVPAISRMAALWHPGAYAEETMREMLKEAEAAARTLRVELHLFAARRPDDFEPAFVSITREHAGALIVMPSVMFFETYRRIVDLATRNHLPAIYAFKEAAEGGGLMAYGANLADLFRRAATQVDKIVRGATAADVPVEQPTNFELIINLKTARALNLTIPPSLLLRADQVIE